MVNFFSRSHFPSLHNLIYLCRYRIELIIGNLTVTNVFISFLAPIFFFILAVFSSLLKNCKIYRFLIINFARFFLFALFYRENGKQLQPNFMKFYFFFSPTVKSLKQLQHLMGETFHSTCYRRSSKLKKSFCLKQLCFCC